MGMVAWEDGCGGPGAMWVDPPVRRTAAARVAGKERRELAILVACDAGLDEIDAATLRLRAPSHRTCRAASMRAAANAASRSVASAIALGWAIPRKTGERPEARP